MFDSHMPWGYNALFAGRYSSSTPLQSTPLTVAQKPSHKSVLKLMILIGSERQKILLCKVHSAYIKFLSDTPLFSFSSDYGTTDKAKLISLKVLNKDNCREVIDSNKEVEKTKAKEGRTEQVLEVKRSTVGLYPDLSLLTDG